MAKKLISWKTKGMNRDTSVSAFNPEFAFENINLRLSTNEGNTMLSWVNERGTLRLQLEIETGIEAEDGDPIYDTELNGVVIGTAVINNQLVLFTTDSNGNDYIYLIYRIYDDGTVRGKYLYKGDLNFNVHYPLETLVSYESNLIQKVYWTDGTNPPRFINIAAEQATINHWNFRTTPFDFVPELKLREEVKVSKIFGSGEFPAGVIQYAFTYYNKYGQESNIFYTTPLQYISYIDRGGSPDSKIANSFKIQLSNLDQNFDYLRIYSILRTSKDATPLVKRVTDIQIPELIKSEDSNVQKARGLSSDNNNLQYFGNALAIGSPSKYDFTSKIDGFTEKGNLGGTAVYGNYLFQIYSNGRYMDIINLRTDTKISELSSIDTGAYNFKQYSTLSFGKDLAPNSMFPYLYCSYVDMALSRIIVFKVTNTWKLERISTIYLPMNNGYSQNSTSESTRDPDFLHYFQNACIDAENHCIWVSGYAKGSYSKNSGDYEDNKLIYKKYSMPPSPTKDYYFNSLEVKESFSLVFKPEAQGMTIKDSKLYQCFSHKEGTNVEMYLEGVDLSTKKESKSYKINQETFTATKAKVILKSPYIYNGEIHLTTEFEEYDYYLLWRAAFSSSDTDGGITSNPDVLNPAEITFIDTGLQGETIDPTELLYKGGEDIKVQTLEQKDGTLFLGNIVSNRPPLDIKDNLLEANGVRENKTTYPLIQNNVEVVLESRTYNLVSKKPFSYINTLSSPTDMSYQGAAGFKGGEYYRLGIQLQYKNGKWSEPCWIGDIQQTKYPKVSTQNSGVLNIPIFKYIINDSNEGLTDIFKNLYSAGYRRVRPVFAVPGSSDRTILLQGVGCPTMWRKVDRYADAKKGSGSFTSWSGSEEGKLYAQSSWLFRMPNDILSTKYYGDGSNGGGKVSFEGKLHSQFDTQYLSDSRLEDSVSPFLRSTEIMGVYDDGHVFYIDDRLATVHTPDVTFDTSLYSMDFTGCGMNFVGSVKFGSTYGDIDVQTSTPAMGSDAGGFVHKSVVTDGAAALITAPFYNDYLVDDLDDGKYAAYSIDHPCIDYPVYLWQKNGSLNNDVNRDNSSAVLLKKKISNYRYGEVTDYSSQISNYDVRDIQLFSSDELSAVKVDGHVYMGNIETMLTPTIPSPHYLIGYPWRSELDTDFYSDCYYKLGLKDPTDISNSNYGVWTLVKKESKYTWEPPSDSGHDVGDKVKGLCQWRDGISMKYKSTPHIVVKLEGNPSLVATGAGIFGPIMDNNEIDKMPLVEITKSYNSETMYGGTSNEAFGAATWIPCGLPISFTANTHELSVKFEWGDTYFQRFECLKTYPFTKEDKNQVVEIASFMVETRVNIDGRYDRNRAQTSNLNMSPQNFNLINPVYSQMDNFFSYKMLDDDDYKNVSYPNNITWTKTKESGADVDLWTNITMANTLEMDGDKGEITKLVRLNNQLLCFQDSGLSQILYNENTQISTTEGVPIEIANSQKVQGKRYLSDTVGCSNKWSVVQTPAGIYFIDSNEKSVYLYNGQLNNLSTTGGFNSWSKQEIPSAKEKWNPDDFGNFVTFYDKQNQDVLFVNKYGSLAYSEKFNCFTSFYDYGGAPFFENLGDIGIWVCNDKLWKHQAGEYCNFFGENKPFSMTLIANQEPQLDKIFTNVEFRACVSDEGTYDDSGKEFTPSLPFDNLEAWDEYQHGITTLNNRNKDRRLGHGMMDSLLTRKFRIWRCDVPRDNATVDAATECPLGIKRFKVRPLDRIRNTWAYLKLSKDAAREGSFLSKVEVHDIVASYFA